VAPFVARLSQNLGNLAFECDPRDSVAREVCYTGYYEPQETQLLARILHAGDAFVDVGANWGYFTLAGAHLVGSTGRVLAFEPEARLYEMLRRNLELNAIGWVHPTRVAIGAQRGRLPFAAFDSESGNWGLSRTAAANAPADFEVESVPLDEALADAGLSRVTLTKIDVEGGEAEVLAGMRAGLSASRYQYILLECHPALLAERGHDEQDTLAPLLESGYRLWSVIHTPHLHRLAARSLLKPGDLLRPYAAGSFATEWPHVLAAAPDAPDLC
jgi:FkbM family methyltransferase